MKNLIFVFSNLNTIILGIWVIFWIIVAVRFFRPTWVKNISYFKLALISFLLNIFYGFFVTWGQYYVWSHGNLVTKTLLNSPLAKEVPIYNFLRPLFQNHLGYFSFYVLGRFWLNILILFTVSIVFYFLLKIWRHYRGGFSENGPLLILILMLISGWPGMIVFVSLGFIFSTVLAIIYYFRGKNIVEIEPVFILASLVALIFSDKILHFF